MYWCDSALIAYESGEPAAPLIKGSVRVASGSAGGTGWSLWAKNGIPDPYGIEQGGVVLNGSWYGLCGMPLSAGPDANFELIDTGGRGVVYGFIQHPYRVAVTLSSAGERLPLSSVLLHGTDVLHRPAAAVRLLVPRDDAARPGVPGTGLERLQHRDVRLLPARQAGQHQPGQRDLGPRRRPSGRPAVSTR